MQDTEQMHDPFIVGERVYLRPLEPAQDNHRYATWLNDEEMRRYLSIYPISDARSRERLDTFYKDFKHIIFGVALKSDSTFIGIVALRDITILNQSAEFYAIIDRSAQGKGYGTEAAKLMARYGFMELNLHRIQIQILEENAGACRAAEKAGFTYEGTMREMTPRFGKFHNMRVYSLLKHEFAESM